MSSSYDALAGEYRQLWEPVLAPSARGLLDRCASLVDRLVDHAGDPEAGPLAVDVGTGAGVLAVEALRRWPALRLVATDSSSAMLKTARSRARAELDPKSLARLSYLQAPADALPVESGSVDLVLSSFVYQLVPNRVAALREALRVLRPGGWIAFVTWIVDDSRFAPADAFDDALDALDIRLPEGESDPVSGDYPSADAAAGQLRRIGFSRVRVEVGRLEHRWDAETYLATQERLWESELLASLDDGLRERVLGEARVRLGRLDNEAFRWRAPIVYAFGERSTRTRRRLGWRRR